MVKRPKILKPVSQSHRTAFYLLFYFLGIARASELLFPYQSEIEKGKGGFEAYPRQCDKGKAGTKKEVFSLLLV